jgi:hypothetical protein
MKSRRFSLSIAFALPLSLVFAFVLSLLMKTSTPALAQTDTATIAPTQNAHFEGKILFLNYVDSSRPSSVAMEQVQVHKLGDRYFLMGKAVDEGDPGNWAAGHTFGVPMNSITKLCQMDSVEELRTFYRTWHPQKGASATPPPQQPATTITPRTQQ